MVRTANLKWNLFAVIAGLTTLISFPRLRGLQNVFENLIEFGGGVLSLLLLQPVAALLSVIGLVIAVIGATRRDLRVAAIGFFVGLVYVVFVLSSSLAWGIEFGSWGLFPLVGLFDYDFADFDVWSWIGYVHHNFVLFLFAALGFLVLKLWTESRAQAKTGNSTSKEGSSPMPAQANFCPTCGEKTVPGRPFCPECGAGLSPGASNSTARYNTLAIVSFVISWFVPVVGFFLAYAGRREIQASGGTQKGDGFVLGALILNWVWVSSVVVILLLLAAAG